MEIILYSYSKRKVLKLSFGRMGFIVAGFSIVALIAGTFLSGVEYASSHSSDILHNIRQQTASIWEHELADQKKILKETKLNAEKSLDAMASRLSLLQGHVMRLDALGLRLASMADLDDMEFGVNSPPGMGGPAPENDFEQQSINVSDFLESLENLEAIIQDRSEKLTAMESMLIDLSLQEQTVPAGHPAINGWLSSFYGYRTDPMTGKKEFHDGLDFAGKPGTLISSVAAGIVTWSGSRHGYGNLVEINHGGGYITRYAHNQKNLVEVGEKVEKGEVIAVMGNSGRSTGTHIHFEVLMNGKHVNPHKYIVLK